MAGLGTRGTVSGKVHQGGSMWAELDPQYFLPAYLDCLNLNLVSPKDSGRNTLRLTQEVNAQSMVKPKNKQKRRNIFC